MNKTAISWTHVSWNPAHGCSKVSDGCKHCYAAELSLKRGWTAKPWTIQNEAENVLLKPHKLAEPYKMKEPQRCFVNSMSDLFHHSIPDWYRAVIFCIMLDLPQHVFQILTKRAEATIDWPERFQTALRSQAFMDFYNETSVKTVKAAIKRALNGEFDSPWGENIWMGTSVEDSRVITRIDHLRQCGAYIKFISAEPLLGPLGKINLEGLHWVIVGGESGAHMVADNPRWMQQEWAREIRDACLEQGIAYFFKQDSGHRTELRTALQHEDGLFYQWQQYPGDLSVPKPADKDGNLLEINESSVEVYHLGAWHHKVDIQCAKRGEQTEPPPASSPTTVVNFQNVKDHWDPETQQWDDPHFVYIGRYNPSYSLPGSIWANPYKPEDESKRGSTLENYRRYIEETINTKAGNIEDLRGKTLICWCAPKPCHGHILLELLGEEVPKPPQQPQQLALF